MIFIILIITLPILLALLLHAVLTNAFEFRFPGFFAWLYVTALWLHSILVVFIVLGVAYGTLDGAIGAQIKTFIYWNPFY